MLEKLIEFIIVFVLCYLIYLFFVILKKKNKKFNSKKLKPEESYLILKYKLDFKKINYKKYMHVVALINSFIFALTLELVQIVKGLFLQILISLIFLVPLILICYGFIGRYYKKKGRVKDV